MQTKHAAVRSSSALSRRWWTACSTNLARKRMTDREPFACSSAIAAYAEWSKPLVTNR